MPRSSTLGSTVTLGDLMTSDPITISAQSSLREAVELLTKHGISGLPVLSGDVIVGTLSTGNIISFEATTPAIPGLQDTDSVWDHIADRGKDADDDGSPASVYFLDHWGDAGADLAERFRSADTPEWDVLEEHTVEEAMSREILTLPPSASVEDAADYMGRTGAHRVLVAEEGILLGVVTTMDIIRYVAGARTSAGG